MGEWAVGDWVVVDNCHRLSEPFQVTEVGNRKLKLSDGSEWTNSAYPKRWGSGRDAWTRVSLRRLDERLERRLVEQKRKDRAVTLTSKLDRMRADLTHEQMDAIEAALEREIG